MVLPEIVHERGAFVDHKRLEHLSTCHLGNIPITNICQHVIFYGYLDIRQDYTKAESPVTYMNTLTIQTKILDNSKHVWQSSTPRFSSEVIVLNYGGRAGREHLMIDSRVILVGFERGVVESRVFLAPTFQRKWMSNSCLLPTFQ